MVIPRSRSSLHVHVVLNATRIVRFSTIPIGKRLGVAIVVEPYTFGGDIREPNRHVPAVADKQLTESNPVLVVLVGVARKRDTGPEVGTS